MQGEDKPVLADESTLDSLRQRSSSCVYVDAFERQVRELYLIDNPSLRDENKEALFASAGFRKYADERREAYTHVYYPWNNHLVKTVRADDYFRLKTDRNQDLITAAEQKKLYEYRVAVLGLSVGSNIAFALTQAGISRDIVIADFDELDTTNLNRIFAGVHQIGLNKAVIAARHIYEDNPFVNVKAAARGIDATRLETLLADKQLDCIIDEVDDMPFKVEARKLAMRYHVPVVMVTDNGEGIVLHVERYDLGYGKIFGKSAQHFDTMPQPMTKEAAGRMIMEDIVGGADRVDPAMLASVRRTLAKELVSWSQLGSAALLGSVIATYIVKQIALGKNTEPDIRAYISPSSGTWSTHEH